jgi:hypothetical protein
LRALALKAFTEAEELSVDRVGIIKRETLPEAVEEELG